MFGRSKNIVVPDNMRIVTNGYGHYLVQVRTDGGWKDVGYDSWDEIRVDGQRDQRDHIFPQTFTKIQRAKKFAVMADKSLKYRDQKEFEAEEHLIKSKQRNLTDQ